MRAGETSAGREAEAAIEIIHERGDRIRERELGRALSELDLSERERAAIEELSERLVDELLAVPEERLRTTRDPELVRAALDLFGNRF